MHVSVGSVGDKRPTLLDAHCHVMMHTYMHTHIHAYNDFTLHAFGWGTDWIKLDTLWKV